MIMSNLRVRDRESHVARKFVWKPNRDNTLPFPLQVKGSKCRPVTVLAEFRFPINRLLPETWAGNEDNNGSVKYWVEVEVKYVRPKWFGKGTRDPEEVSTWKSVVLRNEYALSTLNPTNPYLEKKMLSFDNCTWRSKHVGLWGSKKEIACYVHLPYRGFVQGELIPAEVFINNSSNRTVKNVCLEFIQVYKVISRKVPDQPCILNEIDSSIELEPVGPRSKWHRMVVGIRVPRFSRTDGSFPGNPLISVRFLVRLKIEFWLCNTLKCDVECHVGTKRTGASSAAVEKPTVNQQGLAFYPPNLKELVQVADLPFTLLDPTVRTPHK
ncbi:uncharacterized protein LOC143297091 [Babylonia areolata]|uniref:uncharacterized protein LOC143297091 n=1 Tax=Babylonia areolata TaxID=304850 RepID=UPI003FD35E12